MNKIESIKIRRIFDQYPDTSLIGDYTDKKDNWNICCHCGQYIRNAERNNRICDIINNNINDIDFELGDLEDDYKTNTPEYKRLEKIYNILGFVLKKFQYKRHDCPISHKNYNYFEPYASGEEKGTKEYQEYGLRDF